MSGLRWNHGFAITSSVASDIRFISPDLSAAPVLMRPVVYS
jgi:hypothetical protein